MKKIEITLYGFKELSKEVQESLIANYPEDFDYPVTESYHDPIVEEWTEKLDELGFTADEFKFNGFYSQGDGGSFTGSVNVAKWIRNNDENDKYTKIRDLIEQGIIDVDDSRIIRDRWVRHVHWNTTTLYLTFLLHNVSQDEKDLVCSLLDDLEKDIFKHHQQLNKDYYSAVQEAYDYEASDETIKDILENDTDTLYFENGNVYTEAYGSEDSE